MRVISGKFKNFKIILPTDKLTRPLKDLVKESIFNIIEHSNLLDKKITDSHVLDLYSGSGSFGIECLSRGALKVHFCENYPPAFNILKKNLKLLNCIDEVEVYNEKVINFLNFSDNTKFKYDIIFIDPPYKENEIDKILGMILKKEIYDKNTIIILHRNKKTADIFPNKFNIVLEKTYGLSKIYFGKFLD